MKKNNLQKGFTLIELLVVVAIIGVLASVVLASLNTARSKGSDAAIKENLANVRAQAEIFYDANTSAYVVAADSATDVCSSLATVAAGPGGQHGIYPGVLAAIQGSQGTGGTVVVAEATAEISTTAVCYSAAGTWVAQAPLKSTGYWCVDSTGASVPEGSPLAASSTKCI